MPYVKDFEVKATVSIRKMPILLWKKMKYQAHKEGIKINEMITKIITQYLESVENNDNE